MQTIDWLIVTFVFAALLVVGLKTRRVSTSISDFLAANRCGRRYLLTMAEGMSTLGAISIVMYFEQFYESGFVSVWWGQMLMPIGIFIALSGWVVYRYRETRAMTMAQFFEMRYSRNFRVFAGITAWVSGIINYGIFPAVGARLIIYLVGLPVYTCDLGPLHLNLTLGVVMFVLLGVALLLTFAGGQVTIMVTDFLQAQFTNVVLLVLMVFVFVTFGWNDIIESLGNVPEGTSMINPFVKETPQFGFSYFAILAFVAFYGHMAWQGGQGYNCSAISPHEARMAKVLGAFRAGAFGVMIIILPLLVFMVLHSPKHADQAQTIQNAISQIPDKQLQTQQTVPIGLAKLLPTGIVGLLAAVCAAAAISTNNTYLHSWGSIFIQDVILPFRKKRLTPENHIKLLRRSILGVAIFAWFFSMLFPLREFIAMFFQITGAIYIGGAGAAIIGGLYWKRGTVSGAWAGMITGSALAVSSIIITNILWKPFLCPLLQEAFIDVEWIQNLTPDSFPINGALLGFISSISAVLVYVIVSLLSKEPPCDMDKLLHRGPYAIPGEHAARNTRMTLWSKLFGITSEFSRSDRLIYIITISWSSFWFITFVIGTVYCICVEPFSDKTWARWWLFSCIALATMGVIATVWFLWGGFSNLRHLFRDLQNTTHDSLDDGTVGNVDNSPDTSSDNAPDDS